MTEDDMSAKDSPPDGGREPLQGFSEILRQKRFIQAAYDESGMDRWVRDMRRAASKAFPNACEEDLDEAVTQAIVDFLVDRIEAAGGFAPEDPAAG